MKSRKCFYTTFYEHEFVDSHLRFPNVTRKRYELVLGMFIKRLAQTYIGTLRARFWRTLVFNVFKTWKLSQFALS